MPRHCPASRPGPGHGPAAGGMPVRRRPGGRSGSGVRSCVEVVSELVSRGARPVPGPRGRRAGHWPRHVTRPVSGGRTVALGSAGSPDAGNFGSTLGQCDRPTCRGGGMLPLPPQSLEPDGRSRADRVGRHLQGLSDKLTSEVICRPHYCEGAATRLNCTAPQAELRRSALPPP